WSTWRFNCIDYAGWEVPTFAHAVAEPTVREMLLGVVPPLVLGLAVILVGVAVISGRIADGYQRRLVLWLALGMLGAATAMAMVLEYELLHGGVIIHEFHVFTNTALGGAAADLLVGFYDGRRRQTAAELVTTSQILDTLRQISQRVLRAESRAALRSDVCETVAAADPYVYAWFGVLDDDARRVDLATAAGDGPRFPEGIPLDDDSARGPTARAVETGSVQWVSDTAAESGYRPWRETAAEYGFRSTIAIPVKHAGTIYGVLNIYAARTNAFGKRERDVLAELGRTIGYALYTFDVEDRQQRQYEALARRNEQLEDFASVVSHDLRNPLNVAQLYVEQMREDGDLAHLADVADAHDRLETIIEDLLALARQGKAIEDTEAVALAAVVDDAWNHVETDEATLVNEATGAVEADRSRLRQLLENLFRNAVEHAGPDVTVRVGALPDDAGFFVEDDGPGIPPDRREEVREMGVTTAADGTGFGLAIVDEIAEAHGWELAITDSELETTATGAGGDDVPAAGARFEIRTRDRHRD
ncbi:MAG: ATP-binding protein, partial [Haloarculaceae archaeon]